MDYTIIGGEVNLAARLQSHADLGGILLSHETYALVADEIDAEECEPLQLKGFAQSVRAYKVIGLHNGTRVLSQALLHKQRGLKIEVDTEALTGEDRTNAIRALEHILASLRQ
jgi:hypothetical protein